MAKIKASTAPHVDAHLLARIAGSNSGGYRKAEAGETYIFVDDVSQEALDAAMVDKAIVADAAARETATVRASLLAQLVASDAPMIRTIEDILTALVLKGLILKTDIPQAVLDKIAAREALRSQLTDVA